MPSDTSKRRHRVLRAGCGHDGGGNSSGLVVRDLYLWACSSGLFVWGLFVWGLEARGERLVGCWPGGGGRRTVRFGQVHRVPPAGAALGARYLDTGAMYRAVTLAVLEAGVDPHDADTVLKIATELESSSAPTLARRT